MESRHQAERKEWLAYLEKRDSEQKERDEKMEVVIREFRDALKEVARQ